MNSKDSNNLKYSSEIAPPGTTQLNDGYAKLATWASPTANLPPPDKPKYYEQTYFNWNSDIKENETKAFQKQTSAELEVINQKFNDNYQKSETLRDSNGQICINTTPENIWFAKNVAFIFAIGSIYDHEDDLIMNTILAYFNNNQENAFLLNHHVVENYQSSKLIQSIESKLKITNGNYHVFMVPIVYTADPKILNSAPEAQFMKTGIVNKFMKWPTITEYMREVIAKYGLITTIQRPIEKASWEIGQEGLATKRELHADVECKFDIEVDSELHDNPIQKDLDFKRDLKEDYNIRQRETKINRLGEYSHNPHSCRSKRMKLSTQMNGGITDTELTTSTLVDHNLGVQLRLNEKYHPEEKKYVEYQLYDDPNSYVNGQNIISQMGVVPKIDIQQFPLTNTRAAKAREASIGGLINSAKVLKNNYPESGSLDAGHMAPHAIRTANTSRMHGPLNSAVRDNKTKY